MPRGINRIPSIHGREHVKDDTGHGERSLSAYLFGGVLLLAMNISALFCIIAIFIS